MNLVSNIILCGFMGTGKSAVGQAVSKELGLTFLDTDRLIEKRSNKSVADIFREEGEDAFRYYENKLVGELGYLKNLVIATGGGMILSPGNYAQLEAIGIMILLRATPETIFARIADSRRRPLLSNSDLKYAIEDLLAKRSPIYDKIKYKIDTDSMDIRQVSQKVIDIYKDYYELSRY